MDYYIAWWCCVWLIPVTAAMAYGYFAVLLKPNRRDRKWKFRDYVSLVIWFSGLVIPLYGLYLFSEWYVERARVF